MRHPTSLHDGATPWKAVRIVLASNDEPFRFLVRQTFRKLGVPEIIFAAEPSAVLAQCAVAKVVVLVDSTEDAEAARALVAGLRAKGNAVPVLVAGSSSDRALVAWTKELMVDGLFPKRVSGHELSHRVTEVLRAPRPVPPPAAAPEVPAPPPAVPVAAGAVVAPKPVAPVLAGGRFDADDLSARATAPQRDYALLDPARPEGDDAARRRRWAEELAARGRRPKRGRDLAGLDVSGIVAAHGQWLDSKGGQGARAVLAGKDLGGIDLAGARLANASLPQADLSDACLLDSRLDGADLRRAVLESAGLAGANLGVAQLRHANLRLADLRGACLRGADMAGTRLSGAKLDEADMAGAQLMGADLRGTDLRQVANLTQAQIDKTECDMETRLPAGLVRPARVE